MVSTLHCDESGMCEVADSINWQTGEVDRVVDFQDRWATIVDIAPITKGHCLVVPYLHTTRSTELGAENFNAYGSYVDATIGRLAHLGFNKNIAIEHGSPTGPNAASCVRHAHTHVCPARGFRRDTRSLISFVRDYIEVDDVYSSWSQTFCAIQERDEYILVRNADAMIVGRPRPMIRQISRVILGALNGRKEQGEVDWVLAAENEDYAMTLASVNRRRWDR